jgi:HD-GYP domain-containing protein (c-di-GMP phosphodiesterase class II)
MYVAELDRSWLHTPFPGPGLMLSRDDQVETLQQHCRYVYVDPDRSEPGLLLPGPGATFAGADSFAAARATLDYSVRRLAEIVYDARHNGRIAVAPLMHCAGQLAETSLRHPDASLWLVRMDSGHGLLYRRALGTAVCGVIFGRQLGLDHDELRHLALGGLLLDIGKTAVPVAILAKPQRLNAVERAFAHRHVQQGFALLRLDQSVPARVVEMVLGHHERIAGDGYPRRQKGTDIPLFARIAAIVDTFDALSNDRHYAGGVSGHAALRYLNSQRGTGYDAALVGEFIHAVGVYPTGTRVALADGRSGVVCGQNPEWPLRPRVLVTESEFGQPMDEPELLLNGFGARIARALPPRVDKAATPLLEAAARHTG